MLCPGEIFAKDDIAQQLRNGYISIEWEAPFHYSCKKADGVLIPNSGISHFDIRAKGIDEKDHGFDIKISEKANKSQISYSKEITGLVAGARYEVEIKLIPENKLCSSESASADGFAKERK